MNGSRDNTRSSYRREWIVRRIRSCSGSITGGEERGEKQYRDEIFAVKHADDFTKWSQEKINE